MADDHIQRAYRASQPPMRSAPGQVSAASGDPLAELARLIGQNDPFAEYGHNAGRAPGVPNAESVNFQPLTARDMHATAVSPQVAAPVYEDARYAAPPGTAAAFPPPPTPPPFLQYAQRDHGDPYAQGIASGQAEPMAPPAYDQGPYYANNPPLGAEQEHFYDDAPPRRRGWVIAVAAVFVLAVIGTAGAFGYRALFGSSSSKAGPPPVVEADATPSKVVPAAQSKDPQSGKMIHDRVGNNQKEQLVSREEQPVDIKNNSVGTVAPQNQNGMKPQAALGTGVLGVEPKRIHTVSIHPSDIGGVTQGRPPEAAPLSAPALARTSPPTPAPARAAVEPPPPHVARTEPPVHHAAAPAPSNSPLSLNPNEPAPARTAPRPTHAASAPAAVAPTRTAAPIAMAPATGGGGYAVQISSQHNEADAQASFHSLQAKYPEQLGGRAPLIRRVDLGAKGIYYRAMVGPFGSAEEASQLCSKLKAAGGECIVQKI